MDIATGEQVEGPIDRCRYTAVAWLPGGEAWYYVRRLPTEAVPEGESQYHRRVYLHRLGTDPDTDVLIFGEGMEKTNYYGVSVSRDGRWLSVIGLPGHRAAQRPLAGRPVGEPARVPALRVVQEGVDAETVLYVGRDGAALRLHRPGRATRPAVRDRPRGPLVETWQDLIPEDPEAVLERLRDPGRGSRLPRPARGLDAARHQ